MLGKGAPVNGFFSVTFSLLKSPDRMAAVGLWENAVQILCQGAAGAIAIFLFTRAVTLLGAGRAGVLAALVPGFALAIGFLTIGEVPTLMQLAGFAVVMVGFWCVLRR